MSMRLICLLCGLLSMGIAGPVSAEVFGDDAFTQSGATAVPFLIQPKNLDVGEVTEGQQAHARLFVRNLGTSTLLIARVESACGCTVSSLGSHEVPPGGFTTLDVTIDTTAKGDAVRKKVSVIDVFGRRADAWLTLRVKLDPHADMQGGRGIFDGKCAACHAEPARGKVRGAQIYAAVCVMCHGEAGKGAYAPRLRGLDASLVRSVLQHGLNRRMPAFAKRRGGPLSDGQIDALSGWLSGVDEAR